MANLGITYFGTDGSTWDLLNGSVRLDQGGIEGLGNPKWNRNTAASAGTDGQRRVGLRSRAEAREGHLSVTLLADTASALITLEKAWWQAWDTDVAGTIRVTAPDGTYRELKVYLLNEDSYAPLIDPTLNAVDRLAFTFVADQPFWLGPVQTFTFPAPTNTATQKQVQSFVNPGDIEAWPVWTLNWVPTGSGFWQDGDGTTVLSGVALQTLGGAGPATLVVDYDPSLQNLTKNGLDVTYTYSLTLTGFNFRPIPRGAAQVGIYTVIGVSSVMTYRPRYARAY